MELPQVKKWSAGAQALTLLSAVHERQWTTYLTEPRGLDELATFTLLPVDRLRDVVTALESIGVVHLTELGVALTPEYAALLSDDNPFSLDGLLDEAKLMSRLVADAVNGVSSGPESALTVA